MSFHDVGRMVLAAQIELSLLHRTETFDVPGIVEDYIEEFGFVDVDELDAQAYGEVVLRHVLSEGRKSGDGTWKWLRKASS